MSCDNPSDLLQFPKTPWDVGFGVSSCHLFGGPFRGVTFGGSGVSIGGVGSLRVKAFFQQIWGEPTSTWISFVVL